MVVVAIIMRLPVPEGAVGFIQPGCGEPVQGVIPEQEVPAQRVPSVHVQVTVRVPQGVPHGVPVERGVREALSPWDRAEAHKWGHHACPVQTTDTVHGMDASHSHGHGHGCQGRRVHAGTG